MKRYASLIIFAIFFLTGCANAWQTTYVSAATLKTFVEETHKTEWSEPLNEKITECDPDINKSIQTEDQFNDCMGPYARNSLVLKALKVYNAKARLLKEILLVTDPMNPDKKKLLSAWSEVFAAAKELLALFPNAKKYLDKLDMLLEGV